MPKRKGDSTMPALTGSEMISAAAAGILGLLWFDIRNIRKSYRDNKDGYLTEDKHSLICENSMLKIGKQIDDMKIEIINEIKSNGNGGR